MPTPASGYAGDVTPQEAWDLVHDGGALLVDVRTQAEWAYVGVPDLASAGAQALLIEWVTFPGGQPNSHFADQLRTALQDSEPDRPVVFLCRSGVRSVGAAKAATQLGFTAAYNILHGFEGGLDDEGHRGATGWRAEGLPWRQG